MGIAIETLHLFAAYEKRFSQAVENLPVRRPWVDREREDILSLVQRCLGIRSSWIPKIQPEFHATSHHDGFVIEHLQFHSWPEVQGAADLYLPRDSEAKQCPVVLLACGHAAGGTGKRGPRYQRMAAHLARHGIAVLVSDNIGQGERKAMGHADVVDVFTCGLSVQGLIVMESMGWLRWLQQDPRFDSGRIAAIGNSGGGTLTLFLGALCAGELAAVSSSGYPCTFDYIARKERKHCHCNVLPRIVGELEMWQIYGCIAPKPLLLFQGTQDHFFPADLFRQISRKVAAAYEYRSAGGQFQSHLIVGEHRWDESRRILLTEFLCRTLCVPFDLQLINETGDLPDLPDCIAEWPADAVNADALARQLTGYHGPAARHLWEVFPSDIELPETTYLPALDADVRQIMAQFEAFLKQPKQ